MTPLSRIRVAYEAWAAKSSAGASEDCWRAFLTGYSFAKVEGVEGEGYEVALEALQQDADLKRVRREQ